MSFGLAIACAGASRFSGDPRMTDGGRDAPAGSARSPITCFELDTNRPTEAIRVQRLRRLSGVEFWSISDSERRWSMLHDTFGAWFVRGQGSVPRGRWWSRGEERSIRAGSVRLMDPGESHVTTYVAVPTSFLVVWWSPSTLEQAALELGVSGTFRFKTPELDAPSVSEIFTRLSALLDEGEDALSIEHWYAEATAEVVLQAGEGALPRRPFGLHHTGVRRAVELLNERFRETVTLDELARNARMSKFHLARCFRTATGFSPHSYQKTLRVREARRLLERGYPVSEAADEAGFADASHLGRTFQRWLGVTPGAWGSAWRASTPVVCGTPQTIPPPTGDLRGIRCPDAAVDSCGCVCLWRGPHRTTSGLWWRRWERFVGRGSVLRHHSGGTALL